MVIPQSGKGMGQEGGLGDATAREGSEDGVIGTMGGIGWRDGSEKGEEETQNAGRVHDVRR